MSLQLDLTWCSAGLQRFCVRIQNHGLIKNVYQARKLSDQSCEVISIKRA